MLVQLTTSIAGARFSWAPGEIFDFPPSQEHEAKRLIEKGYAFEVDQEGNPIAPAKRIKKGK